MAKTGPSGPDYGPVGANRDTMPADVCTNVGRVSPYRPARNPARPGPARNRSRWAPPKVGTLCGSSSVPVDGATIHAYARTLRRAAAASVFSLLSRSVGRPDCLPAWPGCSLSQSDVVVVVVLSVSPSLPAYLLTTRRRRRRPSPSGCLRTMSSLVDGGT